MVAGIVEITLNEFVFDNIARRASTTLQKKLYHRYFSKHISRRISKLRLVNWLKIKISL